MDSIRLGLRIVTAADTVSRRRSKWVLRRVRLEQRDRSHLLGDTQTPLEVADV
jgi:hypothetical protein